MLEAVGTAMFYGGLGLMLGSVVLRLTWARPPSPPRTRCEDAYPFREQVSTGSHSPGIQSTRVRHLARLLVGRHGEDPAREAVDRAAIRLSRKSYSGASLWAAIADVAHRMTTDGFRVGAETREHSAKRILEGDVTRAVMNSDKVEQAGFEAVLDEAAERRR